MDSENQTTQQASATQAQPTPFTPLGARESTGSTESVKDSYIDEGWSWGAFMLNWKFAIALREYKYLYLLILLFIPLVNFAVIIGMMIYFGINGREIAQKSKTFANHDQYLGFMKGMDHLGKVLAYIMIVVGVGILILVSVLFSVLFNVRHNAKDLIQYQSYEVQQMIDQRDVR